MNVSGFVWDLLSPVLRGHFITRWTLRRVSLWKTFSELPPCRKRRGKKRKERRFKPDLGFLPRDGISTSSQLGPQEGRKD